MLLLPLGVTPVFVPVERLREGLYYGPQPPETTAVRALPFDASAWARMEARAPVAPGEVGWLDWDGRRWPLPFHAPTGPDVVASAFYWLSGWQEVACRERDAYGRVPYSASLQAQLGTIGLPAVDAAREWLGARLHDQGIRWGRRKWGDAAWALCPTHDIDYVRKWRPGVLYRELVRNPLFNDRREILRRRAGRLARGVRSIFGADPFTAGLDRLFEAVASRGGTATYFWKAGAHGPHDVSYRLGSTRLRRFFSQLHGASFEHGLHPGFHVVDHEGRLAEERRRLAEATGREVTSVRQHYLRYDPERTPRAQAAAGLSLDATLGYSEQEGFRRATCLPFQVYDLVDDRPLPLWEMPLSVMDATLAHYQGLDAQAAIPPTVAVLDTCRRFGGAAVVLWHNTLWDALDYPGWDRHLGAVLDYGVREGAAILSVGAALDRWRGTAPDDAYEHHA